MKYLLVLLIFLVGCSGGGGIGDSAVPKNYTDNGSVISFNDPNENVYIKEIHYGSPDGSTDKIVIRVENVLIVPLVIIADRNLL